MAERVIDISNLSYTYPGRSAPSLVDVSLSVSAGEFLLVSGPTGCGKSTLLRAMNGIIPHDSGGEMSGKVSVLGRDTREAGFAWAASRVGLVFQSPDDQLFSSRPADEVAFGLENLRLDPDEIERRVGWALSEVGLDASRDVPVSELSGGQKQRLAIAALIAMRPRVLALDEPMSQLDPAGAEQVLDCLLRLQRDLRVGIVLVEHRMHHIAHAAGRVVLMDAGRIVLDAPSEHAFDDLAVYERLGLRVPEPVELMHRLGRRERPLTVEDCVARLAGPAASAKAVGQTFLSAPIALTGMSAPPVVDLKGVCVRYARSSPEVLTGIDLTIRAGEAVAVMGPNGSGKSTLLMLLLGELAPASGSGSVLGRDVGARRRTRHVHEVGMLLQNPDLMLLADRVDEEVAAGPRNLGLSADEVNARVADVMKALAIEDLAAEPPLSLSRGQRLRVALASVLSMRPRLLLLDEPTTGQDRVQIESMMDHLVKGGAGEKDGAVIFCTHDVLTAARYASRVIVLAGGRIVANGTSREVFAGEEVLASAGLRPPAATEIARALGLPDVISVDELTAALAGKGGKEERR